MWLQPSATRTERTTSAAILFQALNDVGFTLPVGAVSYWNGEAMHGTDYKDLNQPPEAVASTTSMLAADAAHLARLLKQSQYSRSPDHPPSREVAAHPRSTNAS